VELDSIETNLETVFKVDFLTAEATTALEFVLLVLLDINSVMI
jgi:hypothetical protein